jgi:integrase
MSISKQKGRFRFHFDRIIAGRRLRATKLLPKAWTAKQADDYDKKETAKLYAIASGEKPEALIENAVLLYCQHHCPTLKRGDEIIHQLEVDYPHYAGRLLSELPEVASAIRKLDISEATKRNRIAYIRAACRYAFRVHQLGEHDPAERLVMPIVKNEVTNPFSRKDMLQLARACLRPYGAYVRAYFYSGMRLKELCNCDILEDVFFIDGEYTKSGKPRTIPIHPKILTTLKFIPPKCTSNNIQWHIRKAKLKIGMKKRLHDLRHSTATELVNAGVDLYTVGGILGHADPRSTKRYAHLKTDTLAKALRKIG